MTGKPIQLILFLCCLIPLVGNAQKVKSIKGIVYKKGMLEKVSQAKVTNLKTNAATTSNLYGEFYAEVNIGDTLLIEKTGFTPFKLSVNNLNTLFIYLLPSITLDEVNIKGQTKKQELNGIINDYRSKGICFDGKPPLTAYLPIGGSPLTVLHELFGKTANQEKRFMNFAKRENEATEIDRKYTPQLVSRTTGMTGDSLRLFMLSYRPSHDDIAKWGDYEIILYIKKSYISYKKNGDIVPVNIFKSN
ncbi:hypothetical protein [Mucilaginibacter polytrichastri]|uniref:Uncharacterized protein n=1 Tax=Mucilaginibacter polytrichastri TaxID=1302689 RepID=A0A1Q6A5K2_9SPHI|nr:hypothetical protein [Mucilaginibacter polytrichastri]OKS89283.1 hypothetical protein RG47T_4767 [Mucilaginibacter polytrichastri]SFS75114.1 hypothetical protein SAMN04487890_103318 [Mucilaginibacter polytrichastri]